MFATNGHFSYLIIQFVSVEPVAATRGDVAQIELSFGGVSTIEPLPYESNIANATTLTNVGVPGKYVIDLNGKSKSVIVYTSHKFHTNCN